MRNQRHIIMTCHASDAESHAPHDAWTKQVANGMNGHSLAATNACPARRYNWYKHANLTGSKLHEKLGPCAKVPIRNACELLSSLALAVLVFGSL